MVISGRPPVGRGPRIAWNHPSGYNPNQMKRLLVVVLLLTLPLHFSWALAAPYCQHESGKTVHHFGHHTHQHQASAQANGDAGHAPLIVHADCSICHLSVPAAAVSVQSVSFVAPGSLAFADPPDALPSIFLERLERPNWVTVV